jgi:Domain of unknown function (DUF4402)
LVIKSAAMANSLALGVLIVFLAVAPVSAQCPTCATDPVAMRQRVPVTIEIEAGLDFSRLIRTQSSDGTMRVDPLSGAREASGGIAELGGMALKGTAIVTGEPLAPLRITLPDRIEMRSTSGATAEVVDLQTDLSPAPMLGPDGRLAFSFGGKLSVKGQISGAFRGNIRISADYQ